MTYETISRALEATESPANQRSAATVGVIFDCWIGSAAACDNIICCVGNATPQLVSRPVIIRELRGGANKKKRECADAREANDHLIVFAKNLEFEKIRIRM